MNTHGSLQRIGAGGPRWAQPDKQYHAVKLVPADKPQWGGVWVFDRSYQRVGRDIFRTALLDYWGGACPLTGIAHPRLLRASHMKPWAGCATDTERLDVYNGLLLAAHLDAAFDAGLISFTDGGTMLVSPRLSASDRARLDLGGLPPLAGLKPAHLPFLAFLRGSVFQDQALS